MTEVNVTLYGIPNCNTIKKARRWLEQYNIDYIFYDYRKDGLSHEQLAIFEKELGWEALLNKRGTTYRQLSTQQKADLNQHSAIQLMIEFPAMIKRPLLYSAKGYDLGFKPELYATIFNI